MCVLNNLHHSETGNLFCGSVPAPLKLRPYGAIQMCILLLLCSCMVNFMVLHVVVFLILRQVSISS